MITIKIEAPELVEALHALARALGANYESATVETPEAPPDEEPEIKIETVRAALGQLTNTERGDEARAILAAHGYKKLPDVPKEKYAEILAEAQKLLGVPA